MNKTKWRIEIYYKKNQKAKKQSNNKNQEHIIDWDYRILIWTHAEQDKDKNRENNVQQYITWDQNPLTTMMYLTKYDPNVVFICISKKSWCKLHKHDCRKI